jgi:hypothetical protein
MKIVPDYLEGYLDLERFICLILLFAAIWVGFQAYYSQSERRYAQRQARRFASQLPTFRKLRLQTLKIRSTETQKKIAENPLSYLERVVPEKYLTNLEPINQGNQDYRFELRVESTDVKTALSLLSDFEEKSQLNVTEFTLIRKSLDSVQFHSILRFQIVV